MEIDDNDVIITAVIHSLVGLTQDDDDDDCIITYIKALLVDLTITAK